MKKISAEIVADSINPQGDRITTYLLTFPRFILAELNTHRVFSKNSASSRAIPFLKMVRMVETDPFIPIAWQKDHKGMQGTEYLTHVEANKEDWLKARDYAVEYAENLNNGGEGVTKQICNRLLEPFMRHTVLLTGTEFENFFKLRCPKYEIYAGPKDIEEFRCFGYSWKDLMKSNGGLAGDFDTENVVERLQYNKSQAELHMQALAEAMWDAMNESTPKELKEGKWHIPFGDKIDFVGNLVENIDVNNTFWQDYNEQNRIKIATARCARLSYMTFDGEIDYKKDLKLHDTLLESQHMSPMEHCARAMSNEEYQFFIKGKGIPDYNLGISSSNPVLTFRKNEEGWCNNYKGFIQYRYLIEK